MTSVADTRTARDLGVSDLDDPHDGRPWNYVRRLGPGEWGVCVRSVRRATTASLDTAARIARGRNRLERR